MGSVKKELELKVARETGETIAAIARELGLPESFIVSIALDWFADVMCTPEGPIMFSGWLQNFGAGAACRTSSVDDAFRGLSRAS